MAYISEKNVMLDGRRDVKTQKSQLKYEIKLNSQQTKKT